MRRDASRSGREPPRCEERTYPRRTSRSRSSAAARCSAPSARSVLAIEIPIKDLLLGLLKTLA